MPQCQSGRSSKSSKPLVRSTEVSDNQALLNKMGARTEVQNTLTGSSASSSVQRVNPRFIGYVGSLDPENRQHSTLKRLIIAYEDIKKLTKRLFSSLSGSSPFRMNSLNLSHARPQSAMRAFHSGRTVSRQFRGVTNGSALQVIGTFMGG
jgi:hypothetical protein